MWRRPGGAGTIIYLRGLSGRRHGDPAPNGWLGAIICLVGIFLPSFFLVIGALPFWESLRGGAAAQAAARHRRQCRGGGAPLLAAIYRPVWTTGITSAADFALASAAFLLLFMWQTPPWLVVILSALAGAGLAAVQ